MQTHETHEKFFDDLQRAAFDYFLQYANPDNGLVPDTSRPGSPATIAGSGFALSSYTIAAERGWITRAEARQRTLKTLRFFYRGPEDGSFEDIGHKGFCYHFLDIQSGKRTWECEVSFIDSAMLLAGMMMAAAYFSKEEDEETEIRALADKFYRRMDWKWAQNSCEALALAWKPDSGFVHYRWKGYNEGTMLYLFGLASPTYPLDPGSYKAWSSSYEWKNIYGIDFLYGGPLFIHHFSHAWIDFRDIRDHFMQDRNCDYFENSRRAILIQRHYATENKNHFTGYNENCWGLSASDGPSNKTITTCDGQSHPCLGYAARGVPDGPDDGTISPATILASAPFTPDLSRQAMDHIMKNYPDVIENGRIPGGFNPSACEENGKIWISDGHYALDQGIILLMIENYRSGMVWNLMQKCPHVVNGLRAAGFTGGWLDKKF